MMLALYQLTTDSLLRMALDHGSTLGDAKDWQCVVYGFP